MFAIAITLLVLEIQIEPDGFADLWHALAEEWPSYLAYVTSLLTRGGGLTLRRHITPGG